MSGKLLAQRQGLSGRIPFRHQQPQHPLRPQRPDRKRGHGAAVNAAGQAHHYPFFPETSQNMFAHRRSDPVGFLGIVEF